MASTRKQQAELAKKRAQELLDFNNNASSNLSDKILSILEAGEGSAITRDLLDQFLDNYIGVHHTRVYNWAALRKCLSIKEKVAMVTAERYINATGVNSRSRADIIDEEMRTILDETIRHIEENFINDRDFTESRILRNSAFNRFEIKPRMELKDRHNLNETALKVKKICADNGLDNLAESTDFTNESDAQKIWKISDTLTQLSGMGLKIDADLLKKFEELHLRIKPLRDLDKHYQHMTKALNMLQRNAQKGYHSMVRPAQVEKIQRVLGKLNMLQEYHQEMTNFNKLENFDNNTEHTFLDYFLEKVRSKTNFQKELYAEAINEAQFNERFYSSSAFTLVNGAKLGLDSQKGKAFGDRLAHYEADTQSRRGLVRRRLLDIAERIPGGPNGNGDFDTETDYEIANSYFEKFRDLFFAKEEDNYRDGDRAIQQYDQMRKLIAAIARRRVPALANNHRIRRGSAARITFKLIENALKGTDRGLKNRIRRQRHHADDASIIAMVIMFQNQATNQVFYQDHKKDVKRDSRYGKLTNKISLAERFREKARDRVSPKAKKILTLTEEVAKKSLQLGGVGIKAGNKVGSKLARGTTRGIGALTGKYNSMIKNGGYKRWKTPFYIPYLVTAPTEGLMKLGYKGATYMDREGNKKFDQYIKEPTEKGYEEAKKVVGKATGEETNYLFQGLTYTTEQVTSLAGQTVAATGKRFHDTYDTGQQRSILGAFYKAAKEEKGLADLMQSSDLAELLNFKERGPRLFDEDGRGTMTERIKIKDEKDPEVVGKEIGNNLSGQLESLIKQADAEIKKKIDEEKRLVDSLTDEDNEKKERKLRIIQKEIDAKKEEKTIIKDIHDEITKIIPILKKPTNTTGDRNPKIATTITDIEKKVDESSTGSYAEKLKKDIEDPTIGLTKKLEEEETKKNTAKGKIKSAEAEIKKQEALSKVGSNSDKKDAIVAKAKAEDEKISEEEKVVECNTKIEALRIQIASKKNLLTWINKIHNQFKNLNDLVTKTPSTATPEAVEQLKNIGKNLDILLFPIEEKKDTDTINVKGISDEKRKEIEAILNKTGS